MQIVLTYPSKIFLTCMLKDLKKSTHTKIMKGMRKKKKNVIEEGKTIFSVDLTTPLQSNVSRGQE